MCGGDVVPEEGQNYGTCDSCGTTMTLPTVSDERKVNLFNRANHFRKQNEFDKALTAYENILNEDNTDAEAHWGVLLCRYGIEYVEDPRTHEMTPTCHRVQLESILADADYLAALEYTTDSYTCSLYKKEADAISKIQKGILTISRDEEPYDVFICYKEASETGMRTKDSTIAQDVFYQLEKAGYRTFFARITLEDKVGREYEPYIFSALHSAKVMLVIGTKPSYFNAVWVKNEWSRYLALSKKDKSRLLIPCYMDMDAYDLPEELSFLQSQDMSKIGFIQDLLRGIEKIFRTSKSIQENPSHSQPTSAVPGFDSLYRRGMLFLEDGDFKQADQYFDKVLDISPEYAPAYMGKYFAQHNLTGESAFYAMADTIITNGRPITLEDHNFRKALRFGVPKDKKTYEGYEAYVQQKNEELAVILEEAICRAKQKEEELARKKQEEKEAQVLEQKRLEEQQREDIYRKAIALGSRATTIIELDEAARLFHSLEDYLDSQMNAQRFNKLTYAAIRKRVTQILIIGVPAVVIFLIIMLVAKLI
jgi:tetratricopeptide (TPR) repeat protein